MQKLIFLVFVSLLETVFLASAQAAPGDVKYIGQRSVKVVLAPARRTELRNAAAGVWTNFVPANVDRIELIKQPKQVTDAQGNPTGQTVFENLILLHEEKILTDSEFADLDIAGGAGIGLVDDSKVIQTRSPVILTPAQEVTWSTLCQNVFGGRTLDQIWGFVFYRDTKGDNARIVGEHLPILSANPTAYKAERLLGNVIRPIKRE
jgi:hypothetical protein